MKQFAAVLVFAIACGCQSEKKSQPAAPPMGQPMAAPVAQAAVSLPDAREALKHVGSDPKADAVWTRAINDPRIAAKDRQDLIEDLNETGFAHPGKPSADELPMIKARIALIDRLSPTAMDQTNADAFKEARKDLVAMEKQLSAKP